MATPPSLHDSRVRIATQLRALRQERGWTQAQLARALGLSQARLSEIERGGGSFTAEQLLEALRLFNVTVDVFAEPRQVADELQGALERLGASHLHTDSRVLPSVRVGEVRTAVRETLLAPRHSRLILALAPVIVANVDELSLDALHDDLAAVGFGARVPWLVENVLGALTLVPAADLSRSTEAQWRRARLVLGDFVARYPAPARGRASRLDHLDGNVRSERSLAAVLAGASEISLRWGVVSELQTADFADALRAAHVAG